MSRAAEETAEASAATWVAAAMARAATAAEAAVVVAYMAVAIGGASRQAHRGEGGQGGGWMSKGGCPRSPPGGVEMIIVASAARV